MSNPYQYGDQEYGIDTVKRIAALSAMRLRPLSDLDDDIAAAVQTAWVGITGEAALEDPSLGLLAGYLQAMIERPALAGGDTDDRLEAYTGLAADCLALLTGIEITGAGRFRAAAVELALSAVLVGLARIVTTSTAETRAHAIAIAGTLLDTTADIVDGLDAVSEAFDDHEWDTRYFSQTSTYSIAANLVATCVRYELRAAYDLRVEKRFTLSKPTAPITIAIQEYGDVAPEIALDLIVRANALSGFDILLLPAGREVVVYV